METLKKNKLSHTAVSVYSECGRKYKLHYKDKIRPEKTKSALLFGGALDQALNSLLLTKNLTTAMMVFKEYWTKGKVNSEEIIIPTSELVTYSKNDLDQELVDYVITQQPIPGSNQSWWSLYLKAQLMLEVYHKDILPKIKRVIHVQKKINLENTDGDEIEGALDLIVEWEDGKIYLLDNKSSTVTYEQDSPKKSQQLVLYYYIEKENLKLDGIGYIVLNKNINKNRVKTCNVCGIVNKSSHKTCPELTGKKRCNGDFNVVINPTCDYDIIINQANEILESDEQRVIDAFDKANQGIADENFEPNKESCYGKFGPCQYINLCHKNDSTGLVKIEYKKDE